MFSPNDDLKAKCMSVDVPPKAVDVPVIDMCNRNPVPSAVFVSSVVHPLALRNVSSLVMKSS